MRTIKIGDSEVVMDPSILEFGETNLNEFLQKIGGHHAYFAERHADAIFILGIYEQRYEEIYGKKFRANKSSSSTIAVPVAQAAAKSDPEVVEAKERALAAQLNKDLLSGFLKSIDKAFQAAMNYGYNRRKEMDKLHHDIMESPSRMKFDGDPDEMVASIIAGDSR